MINYQYEASFSYPSDKGGERSTTILFTADNSPDAIQAALRFWHSRQEAFPDVFTQLWCLKIHVYTIGPITEGGASSNRRSLPIFEYKWDTAGLLLAEYVAYKISKIKPLIL